ncbi:hypothetical protein TL16_g11378 [Triparma laevis f. inornata]|uniref:Uncharacterized protein n=1 Tax=Triparma laevis f. inornata TaxID=1714386 RepID=A0A9W7ETB4_9STRA|nr:hypothetical protein TL16_g11378 [Triparma laevis f. inornata]
MEKCRPQIGAQRAGRLGADNPASSIAPSLTSTSLRSRDERISELEKKLQSLTEDSSKKDVALKKYQKFYSDIKARSQRAKKNAIPLHGQKRGGTNMRYNALNAVQVQQQQQQQQQNNNI